MVNHFHIILGLIFCLGLFVLTSSLLVESPPITCNQTGLSCTVIRDNCYENLLHSAEWTPSAPVWNSDEIGINLIEDENGSQVPVLEIKWKSAQDASIKYLKGAQVKILQASDNSLFCINYMFHNKITSQVNFNKQPWSFSFNRFIAGPGQKYLVSVYHLPQLNSDSINSISKSVEIPGNLWEPNISLETNEKEASVYFKLDHDAQKYVVFVKSFYDGSQCSEKKEEITNITFSENLKMASVKISTSGWKRSCCNYSVEIQPFFFRCKNDCVRHAKIFNKCVGVLIVHNNNSHYWVIPVLGLLLFIVLAIICIKKKRNKGLGVKIQTDEDNGNDCFTEQDTHRKVFILYSLDHPMYKEIVLKFTAFLKAECGIDVVLDLLNTQQVGEMGHMNWLAWQKQEFENSSNKILILCSKGVQMKWQAMLTQETSQRVILKEDICSEMGDMFTPALNLILPDFKLPAQFGKYIIAYFDGVSSEQDIPDPFNISVKYKLMKHFEEIYFRIVDKEKHQPGRIHHVQGISADEYFKKPCGRELRNAIEDFLEYQTQNPDWFHNECVKTEKEMTYTSLDDNISEDPVMGSIINIMTCNVPGKVCVQQPIVSEVKENLLSQVVLPSIAVEDCEMFMSELNTRDREETSCDRVELHISSQQEGNLSCFRTETSFWKSPVAMYEKTALELPHEKTKMGSNESSLSSESWKQLQVLQNMQNAQFPFSFAEQENFNMCSTELNNGKRQSSETDQGYMSLLPNSTYQTDLDDADAISELIKLQQDCYMESLRL
uniref:SEFIR domain-containing protein n=1 Tax=Erpetoichthys calabaricus TaxID=27687 RepID=A0A8C4RMR1_ERPCA